MAAKELKVIISGDAKGAIGAMRDTDSQSGKLGDAFSKLGSLAKAGTLAAAVAVTAMATKGVTDFVAYERSMNQVFSLLPGITQDAMDGMSDEVKRFSKDFGVLPNEVIPSLYEALSSGVPADNVFAFLEVAQKAARGGVTELATAVSGISNVTNSYGIENVSAAKASDVLFTTVKMGTATFEELASQMYDVAPVAAAMGIKFEEVGAAMAALTLKGVPARVATTQIRSAIVELSQAAGKGGKAFAEIAGKSFPEFIAQGGNLQGALQLMEKSANETGTSMLDMFGSVEAGQAALALTGEGTKTFTDAQNAMAGSAGATEAAFTQMDKGLGPIWDKLKASAAVLSVEIGEKLAPHLESMFHTVQDSLVPALQSGVDTLKSWAVTVTDADSKSSWLRDGFNNVKDAALKFWNEALVPVGNWFRDVWNNDVMPKATEVLKKFEEWWPTIKQSVLDAYNLAIKPMVEFIADNMDTFKQLGIVIGVVAAIIVGLLIVAIAASIVVLAVIASAFAIVIAVIGSLFVVLMRLAQIWWDVFNNVRDAVGGVIDWIENLVQSAWDMARNVGNALLGVIVWFANLPGRIGESIGNLAGKFGGMWDGILSSLKHILNSVIRMWNDFSLPVPSVDIPGLGKVGGGSLDTPDVGYLHTGGTFHAPAGGQGLALLRDGEKVLTPTQGSSTMSTISSSADTASMRTERLLADILSAVKGTGESSGDQTIQLTVDGQVLAEVVAKRTKQRDGSLR